tara:strand:+ start:2321 stop:2905 length:585 start_codon:yes stop_codon:yes gene_type:complete
MKKSISEQKVQRMRNLATKKFGNKTRIQVGYSKNEGEHVEGEVWEEKGKQWTIKNGITQSVTKLKQARTTVLVPLFCPDCKRLMKENLDKKMWNLYSKCCTCVFDYESDLRTTGKFKDYENKKMTENYIDWLTDIKATAKDFISSVNRDGYITERGKIENWSKQDKQKITEKINKRIEFIESEIKENWQNRNKD